MEPTERRGVKRKRFQTQNEDLASRIEGKLHHGAREVRQAAKKAKTFETQKAVKRLKGIRKSSTSSQEISDLELQLAVLKEISHDRVGNTALKTKLNKDRVLGAHEDVKHAISRELIDVIDMSTSGISASKVHARLFSSKILAAEVTRVVESLRHLVQPELGKEPDKDVPLDERPKNGKKLKPAEDVPKKNNRGPQDAVLADEGGESDVDEIGWESGSVDGSDQGEVDDVGWESGTVQSEQEGSDGEGSDDENGDQSEGDNSAEESSADYMEWTGLRPSGASRQTTNPTPQPPKTKVGSQASNNQSTFLPSLAVGFIRGDSDSEWSETEANIADLGAKKNRRGQRARRAIWEKKYGKNANHKKKEALTQPHKTSRLPQRGANAGMRLGRKPGGPRTDVRTASRRNHSQAQYHQPSDSGWVQRASREKAADNKPIHPSWEAKRKLKGKEGTTIVPSQGKKIVFS